MNLFEIYLSEIKKKVMLHKDIVGSLSLKKLNNVILEKPPENYDFDLSSNIALVLGKSENKNPHEIAKKIKAILSKEVKDFSMIEIAGPGFLNLKLSKQAWIKHINNIFKNKKKIWF